LAQLVSNRQTDSVQGTKYTYTVIGLVHCDIDNDLYVSDVCEKVGLRHEQY